MLEGTSTDLQAHDSPWQVVDPGVDPAPDPTERALVAGITVGHPLEPDVDARSILEHEKLTRWRDVFPEAAWEVRASRESGQELCCGSAVGRMTGDVTREIRGHERGPLIRPPILRQNPATSRDIGGGILDVVRSTPASNRHSPEIRVRLPREVLVPRSGRDRLQGDLLHETWNQLQSPGMEGAPGRIRPLPILRHPANGTDRSGEVVEPLHTPGGDGGVVHASSKPEVHLHIELERIDHGTDATDPSLERGVVDHIVDDREPVTRRGLRIGSVRPELREYPCIVRPRDDLRRIRFARDGIRVVPDPGISTFLKVVERLVVLCRDRQRCIADRVRAHVDEHAIRGIKVRGPPQRGFEGLQKDLLVARIESWWRAGIEIDEPVATIARCHGSMLLGQGERYDVAPFRSEELGISLGHRVSRLVDEEIQAQRLPSVGHRHILGSRDGWDERIVDGRVELVGMIRDLVGSIGHAEDEILGRHSVADGGGAVRTVVGRRGIESKLEHQRVVSWRHGREARRIPKSKLQDPVHRIRDRSLSILQWRR